MLRFLLADFFPDKHQLYDLLNLIYYLCIGIGIITSCLLVRKTLLQLNYARKKVNFLIGVLLLVIFPAGYVSSRLSALFSFPLESWNVTLMLQQIVSGKSHVFHASFLLPGVIVCGVAVYQKFDFRELFDVLFLYLPLAHAIGRVGCFLVGCCWGREVTLSFFNHTYTFINPVPIYSIVFNLALFLSLKHVFSCLYFSDKGFFAQRKKGLIIGLYFLYYGIFRFFLEFFRTNDVVLLGLTRAQVAMLCFIFGGLLITALTIHKSKIQGNGLNSIA